ncbi:hypothetical protein BC939DRAFT_62555 [Gamsiella multidivaricata]|uniref:uncharacterized protein n=1 Tax=Gamsiella multidivaricata TaxID=101098 RepID=UPI00221FF2ED|nr:uncharacterized protein BC939DRAFT_62555 [Gamsiella multidivaricata]KAI7828658.1 hypothetical protein BC939DRAFT_62555 [Gamsiella multidivaricata]
MWHEPVSDPHIGIRLLRSVSRLPLIHRHHVPCTQRPCPSHHQQVLIPHRQLSVVGANYLFAVVIALRPCTREICRRVLNILKRRCRRRHCYTIHTVPYLLYFFFSLGSFPQKTTIIRYSRGCKPFCPIAYRKPLRR